MSLYRSRLDDRVVEAHRFDGSSTGKAEMQSWVDSGSFRKNQVRTMDLDRHFLVPEGTAVGGDWVLKEERDGSFYVVEDRLFRVSYEEIS